MGAVIDADPVVAAEQVLGEDFLDLLDALQAERVDHLIVGAHALSVYGISRATGDLDVFIRPNPETAERILRALRSFGAPLEAHAVTDSDFLRPGWVYQMGLPPWRIDSSHPSREYRSTRPGRAEESSAHTGATFSSLDSASSKQTSGRLGGRRICSTSMPSKLAGRTTRIADRRAPPHLG